MPSKEPGMTSRQTLEQRIVRHRQINAKYRAAHMDRVLAYNRDWNKRNAELQRERLKERRIKNPDKYKARNAVQSALRRGSLTRPDFCSECGLICKPDAHHDDYYKPLEIKWLCRKCHAAIHKEVGL